MKVFACTMAVATPAAITPAADPLASESVAPSSRGLKPPEVIVPSSSKLQALAPSALSPRDINALVSSLDKTKSPRRSSLKQTWAADNLLSPPRLIGEPLSSAEADACSFRAAVEAEALRI